MPDTPKEAPVRPRPRIESLSDLIFGLALSVGSLALVATLPTNTGALLTDLGTFAFTFLILISVWFDYTRIMSVMPISEQRTVTLNTLLLFTVSLEPFLFLLVKNPANSNAYEQVVTSVYALDLGTMMGVLAAFTGSLAIDQRVRLDPKVRENFRRESIGRFTFAAIFFVSVAPIFWKISIFDTQLRFYLWFLPLAYAFITRHRRGEVHESVEGS